MRRQSARASGHHGGKAPEPTAVPGGADGRVGLATAPALTLARRQFGPAMGLCFFRAWELVFGGGVGGGGRGERRSAAGLGGSGERKLAAGIGVG